MNTKNHQNSIDTSNIQITDDSSTSEESPDTHFIIEMSSGKIGGANIRLENVQQENNLKSSLVQEITQDILIYLNSI